MNAILEQINSMGNVFVDFALPMLVQSSVLIVVLLGLDLILRKRVKAVFRYWIWMIVLLKLVLPTTLSSPTSPAYWFGNELHSMMPEEPSAAEEPRAMSSPTDTPIATSTLASLKLPPVSSAEAIAPASSMTWQGYVFLAWLAAVLIMTALLIQRAFFVRRLIAESGRASDAIMNTLERAREQMGIGKRIALRLSPAAASPAVCGLLRPTILIPRGLPDEIDPQHLKSILLHELAHIKRADLWVNSIQAIVQIIYIYNPLLWVANAVIRKVREQAVDEMVLVAMGEQAEEYPKTLLNISRLAFGSPALSLRLIGVVESKKALIGRIRHITSRPFPTSAKLGIGGLLVVIVLSAALLPMAKAEKSSETSAQVPAKDTEVSSKSLHEAAANGDLEQIKLLLAKGADVNAKDRRGDTPLHIAAEKSEIETANLLILKGADVNAKNDYSRTPLHRAARKGHKDIVELLIAKGADRNVRNKWDRTPLDNAVDKGHKEIADLLIEKGTDGSLHVVARLEDLARVKSLIENGADVNAKDRKGDTPLHIAAKKSEIETTNLLILKGADVNARNGEGSTPLHIAAQKSETETANLLLLKGADVNAKNRYGFTPVSRALLSKGGGRPMVEFLVSRGAKVSALCLAARRGDIDKVRSCLQEGTNVDVRDEAGHTPLFYAASAGQMHVVEFLISKDAEVDAKDNRGQTPLFYAGNAGSRNVTELLIAKGADVNAKGGGTLTPLFYAVRRGHKEVAEVLLNRGANVNIKSKTWGYPLLYWAVWSDEDREGWDMTKLLVSKGADVNFTAKDDWPYLHYIAWTDDWEVAELLLAHGAKLNVKDDKGRTALHIALSRGHRNMAEFLVSKGAAGPELHLAACLGNLERVKSLVEGGMDVDTTDEAGFTPLYWATSLGREEVAEFLIEKGADIGVEIRSNRTLLHRAAQSGSAKLARLLISKGSEVNVRVMADLTPLHSAARRGHKNIVELLIAAGADVKARQISGNTPLHNAAIAGHADVVEVLLTHGADVNEKDQPNDRGLTALIMAKQQGHTEIVELLKKHGAEE